MLPLKNTRIVKIPRLEVMMGDGNHVFRNFVALYFNIKKPMSIIS